eukprot:m.187759 g.187759  ORF g.187759 m.187759 type:complete len:1163 (-) comp14778_c0_seq2:183-3671(-)
MLGGEASRSLQQGVQSPGSAYVLPSKPPTKVDSDFEAVDVGITAQESVDSGQGDGMGDDSFYDDDDGQSEGEDEVDEDEYLNEEQEKQPACCLSSPSACCRAISFAHFFHAILLAKGHEHRVLSKVFELWSLLGIISGFFATIAMVGFVEWPVVGELQVLDKVDWTTGYSILFFLALVLNLLCVLAAAVLISITSFIPKGSVRHTLNKILLVLVLPTHITMLGFQALSFALIALTRMAYHDTPVVYHFALVGCAIGVCIIGLGQLYVTCAKPSDPTAVKGERHCFIDCCLGYTCGILTFSRFFKTLYTSGVGPNQIQYRVTEVWTTTSIIGSVVGGTAFEALWQRPQRADNFINDRKFDLYSCAMYLAVIFSMYAVLTSALFLGINLFYFGKDGTVRMLKRYYFVASVPSNFLILGLISFAIGIPDLFLTINFKSPKEFLPVVGLIAFALVFMALLYVAIFYCGRNRKDYSKDAAPKRFFCSVITLSKQWMAVLTSNLSEFQVYTRISNMLSTLAIVSSLVMFLSFCAVQHFSENSTVDPLLFPFSAFAVVSLAFSICATGMAVTFLFLMSVVKRGNLTGWLKRKVGIIFMPGIFLTLSVISFLVSLGIFSSMMYKGSIRIGMIAVMGGLVAIIFFLRVIVANAISRSHSRDLDYSAKSTGCLSALTGATQVTHLVSEAQCERPLFHSFRFLFNTLGMVTALLASISLDTFRELPSEAMVFDRNITQYLNESRLNPNVHPKFENTNIIVHTLTAPDDSTNVHLYGLVSIGALGISILSLFVSTLFSTSLAMVPSDSMKAFLTRIRHMLFIPSTTMTLSVYASITSWWWYGEIEYANLNLQWALRGISLACVLPLILEYIVIARATHAVNLYRRGKIDTAALGIEAWNAKVPVCCEQGCWGYIKALFNGWPKVLLHSGLTPSQIYSRMSKLWNSFSVLGALVTGIAFLAYQKGLQSTPLGQEATREQQQLFVLASYTSLCAGVSGTFLCITLLIKLSFIPKSASGLFLQRLSTTAVVPIAIIFLSVLAFLLSLSVLVYTHVNGKLYQPLAIVCWTLTGLGLLVAASMQLFRGCLSRCLFKPVAASKVVVVGESGDRLDVREAAYRVSMGDFNVASRKQSAESLTQGMQGTHEAEESRAQGEQPRLSLIIEDQPPLITETMTVQ